MKQVGYSWLGQRFEIETLDYWISSFVQEKGNAQKEIRDGRVIEVHRAGAWPGETWTDHLEFALKREGLHLELLRKLMPVLPRKEVIDYIQATPTGRYSRIVWYLYENFVGERLPIDDLKIRQLRAAPSIENLCDGLAAQGDPATDRRERLGDAGIQSDVAPL